MRPKSRWWPWVQEVTPVQHSYGGEQIVASLHQPNSPVHKLGRLPLDSVVEEARALNMKWKQVRRMMPGSLLLV